MHKNIYLKELDPAAYYIIKLQNSITIDIVVQQSKF